MTEHEQQARDLFLEGYNCAQATFGAYGELLPLTKEEAMRLASSLGGGMGRLREVCGAVSGMLLVAGALYGYDAPNAPEEKQAHYARVQELAHRFEEENGSLICRELLGLQQKHDPPTPQERTQAYYAARPCLALVESAARILDGYLAEHPLP